MLLSLLVAYACGDSNERNQKESQKISSELSPEHSRARALLDQLMSLQPGAVLSETGARVLWTLSTASPSLRRAVLDQALARPERTLDLTRTHGKFVTTALAGLSPPRGERLARHILQHAACQKAGSSVAVIVCFELSGHLQDHQNPRGASEETLTQLAHQLVVRVEDEQDLGRLMQLATRIPSLWMLVSPSGVDRSAERLVKEIENTPRVTLRSRLAESLSGPAQRVSETKAGELTERLIAIMETETGFELRSRVVSGIRMLGGRVSEEKADELAERLIVSIETEESVFRLARLIGGLAGLERRVSQSMAGTLAERLIVRMEQEADYGRFMHLFRAIREFRGRMPVSLIDRSTELFVAWMEREKDPQRLLKLAIETGGLTWRASRTKIQELGERLVGEIEREKELVDELQMFVGPFPQARAGELAARLMTRVEKEDHLYRLPYFIRSLHGLGSQVSEAKADQLAERLVSIMEKHEHEDAFWLAQMVEGLRGFSERVSLVQTEALTRRLIVTMREEQHKQHADHLVHVVAGVSVLGKQLPDTVAQETLHEVIAAIKGLPQPPCGATETLVRKNTLTTIFDLLKWPTCTFYDRLRVIASIQTLTGKSFRKEGFQAELAEQARQREIKGVQKKQDKDLDMLRSIDYWNFIAFAETWAQEHQYALDTPPIPPPHMAAKAHMAGSEP